MGNQPEEGSDHEQLSPVNLADYRSLRDIFTGVAAWWRPQVNLTDDSNKEPLRVEIVDVTDNFFSLLGVTPAAGRGFRPGEDRAGGEPVLVLGHELWQTRYGGDRKILGRRIELDGRDYTVIGVAPPGFRFPGHAEVWRPLGWDLRQHSRAAHFMEAIGRLAPGVSIRRAQTELSGVARRLEMQYPHTNEGWGMRILPLQDGLVGSFRTALWLLFGAVGILLLIACANIANILLIQTTSREREVAVRTALGADRRRLRAQFATESVVLALLGGVLALALASAALRWLLLATPFEIPRLAQVTIDRRVLGFTLATSLVMGFLFGLAPVLKIGRVNIVDALKEGSANQSGSVAGHRTRRLLVVSEVFLASMLVASAGLLVRSFLVVSHEAPGINPKNVLTMNVQLPTAKYGSWEVVRKFYDRLLSDLRVNPAILSADATNYLPLDAAWRMPFSIPGRTVKAGEETTAQFRIVGPDYFRAIGIQILRGRSFGPHDEPHAPAVVILNQQAVKQFWGDIDPLGKKITTPIKSFGPLGRTLMTANTYEVAGIAADARNNTLLSPTEPVLYFTYDQFPYRSMYLVLKGNIEQAALTAIARDEVARLDPTLALAEIQSMDEVLSRSVANRRFSALLMSVFAALALLMAILGIYAVLSYAVMRRSHEIGIRMALGARHGDIYGLVLREGMGLAAVGVLLGLACALASARFLASFLYGIARHDWVTFAGVAMIILAGAFIASWLPARRAADLDPAASMKV